MQKQLYSYFLFTTIDNILVPLAYNLLQLSKRFIPLACVYSKGFAVTIN